MKINVTSGDIKKMTAQKLKEEGQTSERNIRDKIATQHHY